ncbi:MAG: NERD domain-containing protein [Nitrospirae bacterium]|nr:NERD domain-containing protein [Nitrospirota bacterium]MCL5286238.1 NERD domain-containing protein [Nitrospirota bacterium]
MASLKSLPASERFEEEVRQFCLTGFSAGTLGQDHSDWVDPFVAAGVVVYFYERNIYTPVGQKEIDGFLATDRGFFVVECKNVSGQVTGTLNAAWQVGRETILVSGSSHANPITQIKNRIGPLASFLRDRKVPFYLTGLIVFPDDADLSRLSESGTLSIHEPPNRDHSYVVTCLSRIPGILAQMPAGTVSAQDAAKVAKLLGLVVSDFDSPERLLRFPVGGFDDLSPAQNERILDRKLDQAQKICVSRPEEERDTALRHLDDARKSLSTSIRIHIGRGGPESRGLLLPVLAGVLLLLLMAGTVTWYYQNRKEVLLIQKKNEEELLPELIGKDPELTTYAMFLLFYSQHPAIPPDKDLLSLAYPLRTREKAKVDPVFRKKFRARINEDMKLVGTIARFKVSISATLVRYDTGRDTFYLTGILPVKLPGDHENGNQLFPTGQIGVATRLSCPFCDSQVLLRDWPLKPSISPRGIFFSFPYPPGDVSGIIAQAPCSGCGIPVHVNVWMTPEAVDAGRTSSGKPFVSAMGSVKVLSIVLDTDGRELYRKNPPSI